MRFLFRHFTSSKVFNRELKKLEKRMADLEAAIRDLKKRTEDHSIPAAPKKQENQPHIKIEHLKVDKIVIEHMDYANNFGQLGIKDLSGKLNIGTTNEGDFSKQIEDKLEEKLSKLVKVKLQEKK